MKTTDSVQNEFPAIFDGHSRLLILGSMPSEASRAAGFYYMNPRNRFWKVMTEILGEPFETMSAEDKTQALLSHGIALSDVVLTCEIRRSSDASIKNVTYTDIPYLLARSEIEKILLNGGKAHELFLRGFPTLAPLAERLPSTSPANARDSLDNLIEIWKAAILH